MKRVLIILSAALLWCNVLPAAATEFEAGDFCYTISAEDLTAEVISVVKNHAGLSQLSIPESVEYEGKTYRVVAIGNKVFSQCTSLTSISIPDGITSIGDSAFWSCSGLKTITIPDNVTTIGHAAFFSCEALTSVTIGSRVTTIGDFAFYNCRRLTTITIPDKVASIGKKTFLECKELQSVILGKSIANIGDNAFENCGLKQLTVYNAQPPKAGLSIFKNVAVANCTLYVPVGSAELYQKAKGWKDFGTIEETEVPDALSETQQTAEGVTVYNLQGVLMLRADDAAALRTLPAGAYIVNGKTMIIAR